MCVPQRPEAKARQGFFPNGSRSVGEIDRLQIGDKGTGNLISEKAEIDFYRVLPPAGYTTGLPAGAPMPAQGRSHPSAAACLGPNSQCGPRDPGERQI
jgi:hypothetical protein